MTKLAIFVAAVAAALAARAADAQEMRFFRIASGSAGGTYFPIAGIMAQAISNPPGARPCDKGGSCGVEGLVAIAQSSNGSVANTTAVEAGQVESGLAQSDVTFWAYSGTGVFKGKEKKENLRVIASLYPEHVHVVARAGAGVETLSDLKGKTVGIGLPASGAIVDARIVLETAGLKETEDYTPEYLNSADSIARMREGRADAMIAVTGYPQPAIADLTSTVGGTLIPVEGKIRDEIVDENKFFAKATIPGGLYKGNPEDTDTVAVTALWITSAEQSEELIYAITKALWNDSTRMLLDGSHAKGKSVTLDTALEGVPIPLHPGAELYYREAGIIQ